MTLPPKEEVLERESRWLRPAGFAALFGTFLFAAGQVVQSVGLEAADNQADRFAEIHEHAGQVLAGHIVQAVGIGMFAIPLFVLFKAADARAERMRGALVGFCLIGPILFGVGSIVASFGQRDAADQFVDQAPAVEQEARQKAEAAETTQAEAPADSKGKRTEGATTAPTEATTTETTTGSGDEEQQSPDEAVDDARENLADRVEDDSSLVSASRFLLAPGVLSFLFAMVYTCLWATRTGLLARFSGSLGMALGVALVLIPAFGLLLTVLWFGALGFRFVGVSRGGLPPAWGAGVAIPWEPPGGAPPPADDEAVEGSGREVSEPALPEGGDADPDRPVGAGPDEPLGETQGQRRKKRKRRS